MQLEGVKRMEHSDVSTEETEASFQEKLLVEMHIRPVPKPTQVGAQRM